MLYVVSLGMLVAVAAWVAAVYSRLNFLHGQVQDAWLQWVHATRRRNECLGDFTAAFAACLPQGSMLPRNLRRLTEDSRLALAAGAAPPRPLCMKAVHDVEEHLQSTMRDSVSVIENDRNLRENTVLVQLCNAISLSVWRQEQEERNYNRYAGDYNNAIDSPAVHWVAEAFGFEPASHLRRARVFSAVVREDATDRA